LPPKKNKEIQSLDEEIYLKFH